MAEKVDSDFRLTYATMYDPPEELHENYEAALEEVRSSLGAEHAMIIDGQDAHSVQKFEDRSPINQEWVLGSFQSGYRRRRTSCPGGCPASGSNLGTHALEGTRGNHAQGRR